MKGRGAELSLPGERGGISRHQLLGPSWEHAYSVGLVLGWTPPPLEEDIPTAWAC